MSGSSEKYENYNDKTLLRFGLLFVALLCSVTIFASSIVSTAFASVNIALQNQISLTSKVYVIRTEIDANGAEVEVLKTPNDVVVIPGDRLKFILSYQNETGQIVDGFKATNPMPAAVQFSQVTEDWAEVSVDGGQNWGKLENLSVETKVPDSDRTENENSVKRAAGIEDVTHVRWVFDTSIAVNESGDLSFEGVVK